MTTCSCCSAVMCGNSGSESSSAAARSATGKSPPPMPEMGEGALEVERDGIVDAGADAVGREMREHAIAMGDAHDVEVPHVLVAGQRSGQHDVGEVGEQRVVAPRGRPPRLVPVGEPFQLGAQHDGLQSVEARVEAEHRVMVLDRRCRSCEAPAGARRPSTERVRTAPPSPYAPRFLPGIEARRGRHADAPTGRPACGSPPGPARRPRAARRPVRAAASGGHRRHLPVEVHGDDTPWCGSRAAAPRRGRSGDARGRSRRARVARRRARPRARSAMKVFAGTITSSPRPMSTARSASSRASVPLATPTQCSTPTNAANSCSKAATSGPRDEGRALDHRGKPRGDLGRDLAMLRLEIDERDHRVTPAPRARGSRASAAWPPAPARRQAPRRPPVNGSVPAAMHSRKWSTLRT